MIHGFSSCGILESQYQGFAEAAKIGNVGDKYIDYVYGTMGYMQTVLKAGDDCMTEQIHEVQNTDSYQQRNGATVITDCRHDSTANAYHSTVAMLSYETKHVVAVQTVTKEVFRSSQTHEFEAMQQIIPAVQAKGLTVIEVAHDFVLKIKNWLLTLNIQNSFDTWHEMGEQKEWPRAMKEISCGAQKWEGEKWFAELSDKQASVKRHFYYSMKNCTSPDNLRRRLLTILDHYQGNHTNCDPDSKCKNPGYRCSKVKLNNPRGIAALHKFILDSKVYKLAEDYYLCRDTYWVESFNNVILIYCPKRIHFADPHFQHAHCPGSNGLE
ncbi:Orexin receptor type 2 [Desmophyllum pertusum]|uniref:Orexin receptor type 2 n=1 Tax=Desmophyllum pertusum TaxID=174260 RepID=A0A9W9Y6T0_9CNID|nr:Orexin receptor type 2 [Desmophyllum pertusum]